VVDTSHFKGNFPDSITIEGAAEPEPETGTSGLECPDAFPVEVLPPQKLGPHRQHFFVADIRDHQVARIKNSVS
jgi:allantoicase